MQDLSSMILHILTDKSGKILQSPSRARFVTGMISPDIVPKSEVILHRKSCKIIEVLIQDLVHVILQE